MLILEYFQEDFCSKISFSFKWKSIFGRTANIE